MKKLSQLLSERRKNMGLTTLEISSKLGILEKYISAIEKEEFEMVPAGYLNIYVRDYALCLGIDAAKAVALLRRDNPECVSDAVKSRRKLPGRNQKVNYKKAENIFSNIFSLLGLGSWQFISFGLIILLALGFLGFQYLRFNKPPKVILNDLPEVVISQELYIQGKTNPEVLLKINDQATYINNDGSFSQKVLLVEGENIIFFEAESPSKQIIKFEEKVVFLPDNH
jgi:cytoskeletal protein RodZ